jgi:uncharacterized membrane protein
VALTLSPEAKRLVEDYLKRLDRALEKIPQPERGEIRVEIQSHIRGRLERLPQPIDPEAVLDVLYQLGEPKSYIPLYLTESYLRKGFQQPSPQMLMKGVLRWMASSAVGYLYSFPFFLLYFLSFLFLSLGILKLLFPENVAILYVDKPMSGETSTPVSFRIGFMANPLRATAEADAHPEGGEFMGIWAVPFALGIGVITALGATVLLRWLTGRVLKRHFEYD